MHRLSWRRCEHSSTKRRDRWRTIRTCTRPGPCSAALPGSLALPVERQSRTLLHTAESREPGICPLCESVGLSRGNRSLRCLPPGGYRRQRSQPHGNRRNVLGRRFVQQRHPAVQELRARRGLYGRRRAGRNCGLKRVGRGRVAIRYSAGAQTSSDLGVGQARRHFSGIRAWRTQHIDLVPRNRHSQQSRSDPEA